MKINKSFLALLLLLLSLFFALRLPLLGPDISNSDAARWHIRSVEFFNALKKGDLASTYQHNQPGVTLMWIGAAYKNFLDKNSNLSLEDANHYLDVHSGSKFLLVSILGLLFLIQLLMIKKLYGLKVMIFYGLFVATEPFLVGVDRLFHVTSLETYLLFTSFLSLLVWQKSEKLVSLILFAIFFALSLLTKTSSLIVLPVFLFILFAKVIRQRTFKYLLFFLIVPAVYFILFPAMWVNFGQVLGKIVDGVLNGISSDSRTILYTRLFGFLYYPGLFLYKASLIFLITSILTIISFRKKENFKEAKFVLFYMALFYVAYSISVKKIDRYLISLFPPLILCSALYLGKIKFIFQKAAVAGIVLCTVILAYLYFPVYTAYYSPIFFGSRGADKLNLYSNSGQYFSDAAFFINTLPRDTKVLIPFNKESFHSFYNYKQNEQIRVDKSTDFIILSFNKLSSGALSDKCQNIVKTFGSRIESIVFVYECNSSKNQKPTL